MTSTCNLELADAAQPWRAFSAPMERGSDEKDLFQEVKWWGRRSRTRHPLAGRREHPWRSDSKEVTRRQGERLENGSSH